MNAPPVGQPSALTSEKRRQYVAANREKVREYYDRYFKTHRDEVNASAAARRDADPDHTKRITRQWAERNKERRAGGAPQPAE
ncbi:hypothetical protein [Cryobacterium ruanii]|uniref:Uncharacterized protein n=1 Tax=Cryobacterium ruanii TaxID=1259197 RepID=A0A4R9AR62_9MICO|nr:hypothetical protein [Cryobacterium ruanii]TFD67732.1 hypothetical protein E3T47_03690 [Cryobacterium ruanii]